MVLIILLRDGDVVHTNIVFFNKPKVACDIPGWGGWDLSQLQQIANFVFCLILGSFPEKNKLNNSSESSLIGLLKVAYRHHLNVHR